ncbi:MAG: ComF family protein [Geobacteraceae bacterium]|nr:ComF family protein [Geobacteraceae bacterium]
MNRLMTSLLDFLFPPLCHICRSFIADAGNVHICAGCRAKMPLALSPLCTVCGIPFAGAGDDHICGQCLLHPPNYDSARAHLLHQGAARELIHAFKYRYKTHLRRPLALLALEGLTAFITRQGPDVIIPVPLHRKRLQSRGFNQAVLLGEVFSTRLSIPMQTGTLLRIRQTEPQIELSVEERRSNVKGAFAVNEPERISDKRVLLLDDVMTTGSTVNECSKELKKAGALSVTVATVARTAG